MRAGLKSDFLSVSNDVVRAVQIHSFYSFDDEDGASHWAWIDLCRRNNIALTDTWLSILEVVNQEPVGLLVFEHHAVTGSENAIWGVGPWHTFVAVLHLREALAKAASGLLRGVIDLPSDKSAGQRTYLIVWSSISSFQFPMRTLQLYLGPP